MDSRSGALRTPFFFPPFLLLLVLCIAFLPPLPLVYTHSLSVLAPLEYPKKNIFKLSSTPQQRDHFGHSHSNSHGHGGHYHHHDNTYLVSKSRTDAGLRITRIGLYGVSKCRLPPPLPTRNVLTFVNTTAIAYRQNSAFLP